jgi:hypothetical protein
MPPINLKRVAKLAAEKRPETKPAAEKPAAAPTDDLANDLARGVERLKAARLAFDVAFCQFQIDTKFRMTSADPIAASDELASATAECLRLGGLYWNKTMRQMHGDRKRYVHHTTVHWARLFNAYAAIVDACPEIIENIREAAPSFADTLTWMEFCATGRPPT